MIHKEMRFIMRLFVCVTVTVFCDPSFADFLQPRLAYPSGNGISILTSEFEYSCPEQEPDCQVGLEAHILGDFSWEWVRNAPLTCSNGVCPKQHVSIPFVANQFGVVKIVRLLMTVDGELIKRLDYAIIPIVKPIVVLDPGHGLLLGDDGRKHYQRPPSPTFGLREDNLTLAIANAAKTALEAYGNHIVVMTRTGPDAPYGEPCGTPDPETDMIDYCKGDLKERIAIAQKAKSRAGDKRDVVFVSIHTNGGNGRPFRGRTQTFYCRDEASTLADRLLDEITALVLPVSSLFTGGYRDCDLAVIAKTAPMGIPGSLIEVLYHSDLDDESLLNKPNMLNKIGYRISQAVHKFINMD